MFANLFKKLYYLYHFFNFILQLYMIIISKLVKLDLLPNNLSVYYLPKILLMIDNINIKKIII